MGVRGVFRPRIKKSGYVGIRVPEHPRADRDGRVMEHIIVAESALGKFLPPDAVVHHVNEDHFDNRPCNLVICESNQYHKWLHIRLKVVQAGGDPQTQKICSRCQILKPFSAFYKSTGNYDGLTHNCKDCTYFYGNRRFIRLKEAAAKYRSGACRCDNCSHAYTQYQATCGLFAQRRRKASLSTASEASS